jgi:aldehyde:ferredoxin oxidoreductase
MLNHVTGFDYTLEEVMKIGRRVWYLKRGLTNFFGARAKDDRLPARLMTPLDEGPTEGRVPDMELMLKTFYQLRALNEDGLPQEAVLREMGLADLADLLYPKGQQTDLTAKEV